MMHEQKNTVKLNRDLSIDFIRVIATFLVICCHVSANGFYNLHQRHWWAANCYESIGRISVPLFFMVTGALLLAKQNSISSILKRLVRIGIPLITWSIIYLIWFRYRGFHFNNWALKILKSPVQYHLWYLYTLFGAYIFLPVMSGFFKANSRKTLWFVITAWFIGSTILPTVWHVVYATEKYQSVTLDFLSLYGGYMVLGAILYHKHPTFKTPTPLIALIWIVSTIATGYFTRSYSIRIGHADETFYNNYSPFVALGAATGFIVLRKFCQTFLTGKEVAKSTLSMLARLCFGIYLIHALFLDFFYINGFHFNFMNPWVAIPVVIITTFVTSAAAIGLLQKIPFIRLIAPS